MSKFELQEYLLLSIIGLDDADAVFRLSRCQEYLRIFFQSYQENDWAEFKKHLLNCLGDTIPEYCVREVILGCK